MNKKEIKELIRQSFEKDKEFEFSALAGNEDENLFDDIIKIQKQIFKYFGLPFADRFIESFYEIGRIDIITNDDVNEVFNKMTKLAEEFLLLPILPDVKRLTIAQKKQESVYDTFPELKIKEYFYFIFLYNNLLLNNEISAQEFLDEIEKVEKHNLFDDITFLNNKNKDSEKYKTLKLKYHLHFIDKYFSLLYS